MNEMFGVAGKTVCITGSSRGLGYALASGFLKLGARVVLSSHETEELRLAHHRLTAEGHGENLASIKADVTSEEACRRLVEKSRNDFGPVDVMICNAGIDIIKPAQSYTPEEWNQIIAVNLTGCYFAAKSAAECMLDQCRGSIIMTSSVASKFGIPGLAAYSASKGGINQLIQTMAVEWAEKGIRVNGVAPGYINNYMNQVDADPNNPYQTRAIQRTPMNRRGEMWEFLGPYVFLASEASSYITGEVLNVDGGYCAS